MCCCCCTPAADQQSLFVTSELSAQFCPSLQLTTLLFLPLLRCHSYNGGSPIAFETMYVEMVQQVGGPWHLHNG
jgi:hypothetical protein